MNKNSNSYTFIFSSVLIILVAVLLASAAIGLKPFQDKNVRLEKMQNILASVGVFCEAAEAQKLFDEYIVDQIILDSEGKAVEGTEKAFDLNLRLELKKDKKDQKFPMFVCKKDGKNLYIVPMRGKGLWGPIWGYVSVGDDFNTLVGANFDHKSETPGLGAEISTKEFQAFFPGKKLFDDKGEFQSVSLKKGGNTKNDLHGVDAISGGTITSNGLTEMLYRTFDSYTPWFKSQLKPVEIPVDSLTLMSDSLLLSADTLVMSVDTLKIN